MKRNPQLSAVPLLLLAVATLVACISYEAIPVTEIGTTIEPGDRVIVTTNDGKERTFDVEEIDIAGEAVVGNGVRITFEDIALLERRRFLWQRTAAAVGGTSLLLIGLFALALVAAFA